MLKHVFLLAQSSFLDTNFGQKEDVMPFWRTYYHLVWATKNRSPWLTPAVERRLYPYLIRKAGELGVQVYAADGWLDHMHVVASIPPKHAVAYVVKCLKGASSFEMKGLGLILCRRLFEKSLSRNDNLIV